MGRHLLAALLPVAALVAGCDDGAAGARGTPELRVSAAATLKAPLTEYGEALDGVDVRFSFAGSDQLAAQIRAGGLPDVYAAASATLPRDLHGEGLVEEPIAFARNELVVAVPAGSGIAALDELDEPGIRLAIGSPEVPVGAYAREVLERLGEPERTRIRDNVRSEEPDVSGIVGKIVEGAVDAGFTYRTDVIATNGRLEAVGLPAALEPDVLYEAAVVVGSERAAEARAFLTGLLDGPGAAALRRAGFLPPP